MITNQVELNDVHNSVEPIFENLLNHLTEVEVDEVTGNARNYSISTDTDDVADIIAAHGSMYETLKELLPSKLDQSNDKTESQKKLSRQIEQVKEVVPTMEPKAAVKFLLEVIGALENGMEKLTLTWYDCISEKNKRYKSEELMKLINSTKLLAWDSAPDWAMGIIEYMDGGRYWISNDGLQLKEISIKNPEDVDIVKWFQYLADAELLDLLESASHIINNAYDWNTGIHRFSPVSPSWINGVCLWKNSYGRVLKKMLSQDREVKRS